LILPDLPIYEFETEYGVIIKKYGLDFIFLVTPETSAERIKKLDELSSGFLYAVSSSSTTGKDKNMLASQIILRIKRYETEESCVGGILVSGTDKHSRRMRICKRRDYWNSFYQALENKDDVEKSTEIFLKTIL